MQKLKHGWAKTLTWQKPSLGKNPHQKNLKFFILQKCSRTFLEHKTQIVLFQIIVFFSKSVQIYMEDAELAESKEKSNFRFLFFELWSFL